MRAQYVEQRALAVGEVAPRAIEHEADEQPVAYEDRQRHGVIDANLPVVVVIERAFAEACGRQAVADALRDATTVVAMEAHQRMLLEMAIERRSRVRTQAGAGQSVDVAAAAHQVAD